MTKIKQAARNHYYPCLLVRQVDQFEELDKSREYHAKTPAASCGG